MSSKTGGYRVVQAAPGGNEERRYHFEKGARMGLDDKFENKKDEVAGTAKQKTGEATDDEQMESEGRVQKAKGNVKQAGEKIKDAFKD